MDINTAKRWLIKHYLLNQKLPLNKRNTPNLIGSPGIGKTDIIYQTVQELNVLGHNIKLVKVDLAGMSEPTDVTGYQRQGYRYKDKFYTVEAINLLPTNGQVEQYLKQIEGKREDFITKEDVLFKGTNKLENLLPSWWPVDNEKVIVIFDDYNRCSQQLMQTVMPLVYEHAIHGYPLPKGSMIIATSNPDDGINNVNSQDIAQDRRVLNFYIKFKLGGHIENGTYVPGFVDYLTERSYNEQFISFITSDCVFEEPDEENPISGNLYENPASIERFLVCVKEFCGDKITNSNKNLLLELGTQNFKKGSLLVQSFINKLNNRKYDIPTTNELKNDDFPTLLEKINKISNYPAALGILCERFKNIVKEDIKHLSKVIHFTNDKIEGIPNELLPNYRSLLGEWIIENYSDYLFEASSRGDKESKVLGQFYQEMFKIRKEREKKNNEN